MLDNEFHLSLNSKATLISVVCPHLKFHLTQEQTSHSLNELRELLKTLGIQQGEQYVQNRKTINPATILGSGKLIEIAQLALENDSDMLIFDCELTSSQIRNIKKITHLQIVDRCHVILEIFARHARTKEAKIQIEIARLNYILPRLSGFWSHLGRQKGGIGVRGGEGEQQIELDRRIIRQRIEFYKNELKEMQKSRIEQKKKRQNNVLKAALVGYTNVGKSSLMNRLCKVKILEEDKLFATLDPTFRTLNPDSKPNIILIDTVGFISNLPNTLIEGFKTTLESALEADLIIHVCDISDPNYRHHMQTTKSILKELNIINKKTITVFNKKDLLEDQFLSKLAIKKTPHSFIVSSYDEQDMENLRSFIIEHFLSKQEHFDLFIPYDQGHPHSIVAARTNILKTQNLQKGIFYRIRIPQHIFNNLGLEKFILNPKDPIFRYITF